MRSEKGQIMSTVELTPGVRVASDKFRIIEIGLYDAAEKWLKQRAVDSRDLFLWCAQLDTEEKSIEFREWSRRVRCVRKDFVAAGWREVYTGEGPHTAHVCFTQRIAGVDVGVGFGCIAPELWEVRPQDPEFRALVSETGYLSFTETGLVDVPEPEILNRDIERLIEGNRAKAKKSKPRIIASPCETSAVKNPEPKEEPMLTKSKSKKTAIIPHFRAGRREPLFTFDPKAKKGSSAIGSDRKLIPSPDAVIDVASVPAEKLTTVERKTLTHCEQTIKRGAEAFLATGDALTVIQEQRLYREKYSTFEAYLWDKFHLERSVAYRWIKAAATHTKTSAIADKLKLVISNEAQLRAIETVSDVKDLEAVLKRAARQIEPDADGMKIPTAKILARARKEEFTSPADLKLEAQRKRGTAREKPRDPPPAPDAPSQPRELVEFLALPAKTVDGSRLDYWNGRPRPYAGALHILNSYARSLWARYLGQGMEDIDFREDLKAWALQLQDDIICGAEPSGCYGGDGAKGGNLLDGRQWKEMPAGQTAPKAPRRAK